MKKTRWLTAGGVLLVLCLVILYVATKGIGSRSNTRDTSVLNVVILDSGNFYDSDAGIKNGISMAMEKAKQEQGIDIHLNIVDDEEDYTTGISMAQSLANDDNVDVVLSFQNFESIGPVAEFFEEAKKPLIVTMGCYDDVADSGFQYFIADFLSAKDIGARIGTYIADQGFQNIALCHSDTPFEKDELKGLQSVLAGKSNTSVRNSMTGPFQEEGLPRLLMQCEKLDVDVLVPNFYNQEDSAWLVSRLRSLRPDLTIVGDYALDSTEILTEYGKDMEGIVIVPNYPYTESKKLSAFRQEYEQYAGESCSTAAIQYYDLFCMLASSYKKVGADWEEFMQDLKSEAGYEGVAGTLHFDESGWIQADNCPVFVCRNGKFVLLQE